MKDTTPSSLFPKPDKKYMERALQLARYGAGFVSPNPMVGAVIVTPDGRIIGEGWHRKFGGPHAEVNAVSSVKPEDEVLLPESTIYVTLEPCSHYGKTPPCSLLLINKKLGRVVVGSPDPFPLVRGRGIKMLREAGIEVIENFMQKECDFLNRRFITAHTHGRPYILLKWAQSADGYIAGYNKDGNPVSTPLSTPLTLPLMHSVRAVYDAILVGVNTVIIDNPSLITRLWPGNDPRPVTFDSRRLPENANIISRNKIMLDPILPLHENMSRLYKEFGITSLIVEGGADTLSRFITSGLYDEIRLEISPLILREGVKTPDLPPDIMLTSENKIDGNLILEYQAL